MVYAKLVAHVGRRAPVLLNVQLKRTSHCLMTIWMVIRHWSKLTNWVLKRLALLVQCQRFESAGERDQNLIVFLQMGHPVVDIGSVRPSCNANGWTVISDGDQFHLAGILSDDNLPISRTFDNLIIVRRISQTLIKSFFLLATKFS